MNMTRRIFIFTGDAKNCDLRFFEGSSVYSLKNGSAHFSFSPHWSSWSTHKTADDYTASSCRKLCTAISTFMTIFSTNGTWYFLVIQRDCQREQRTGMGDEETRNRRLGRSLEDCSGRPKSRGRRRRATIPVISHPGPLLPPPPFDCLKHFKIKRYRNKPNYATCCAHLDDNGPINWS